MPSIPVKTSTISVILLCLRVGCAAPEDTAPKISVTYDYPPQHGQSHLLKTDPDRVNLTDNQIRGDGKSTAWGQWNAATVTIDWQFDKPVRIESVDLAIVHPNADSDNSHPGSVTLFGSAANQPSEKEFASRPDASFTIPFESGKIQKITLTPSAETSGIVCRRVRTVFKTTRFQVALSEVKFKVSEVSQAELDRAQSARSENEPPALKPVRFIPPQIALSGAGTSRYPESIFGFCGHMIHTDEFYFAGKERFSEHWRLDFTLPFVISSHAGWVREPLYGNYFKGPADAKSSNTKTYAENRQKVEHDLTQYDRAGIKVLLCPLLVKSDDPALTDYLNWIIQLAKSHPCIRAIEIHNEPNLGGFWNGTATSYADACIEYSTRIKRELPNMQIVVGSMSGWGHGQHGGPDDKNYPGGSKGPMALAFAEQIFNTDLLAHADAVSAHPYRNYAAPEGGVELESPKDPLGFEKEIKTWWNLVQKYNKTHRPLKVHFSELGYSVSSSGYATVPTEERQADYASRLMMILFNTRLEGFPLESVLWYDLKNDENRGEYESNFGMIAGDTSRVRPAFLAFRRVAETFHATSSFAAIKTAATFSNEHDNIKTYTWKNIKDNSLLVSFWRMNQLQKVDRDFPAELSLTLPADFGSVQSVELTDLHEDRPRPIGFKQDGNTLIVPLNVTARAAWIVIRR